MRKRILNILLMLLAVTGIAQSAIPEGAVEKGSLFANGSAGLFFTTNKLNEDKSTAFTADLGVRSGYFLRDNLALGLELSIRSNSENQDDGTGGDIQTKTTSLGFLPLARYYFDNGIFGEAGVGVGFSRTNIESGFFEEDFKSTNLGFRIGAGYAVFLNNRVAIEPSVNYSWEDVKPDGVTGDFNQSLSSLFFNLGITVFF